MALKTFLIIIIVILAFPVFWLTVAKVIRKLAHFPTLSFIGCFLDSNYRRKIQPPDRTIQRSVIKQGMQVLEVGCGSGAFTTFVAQAVGEQGKVYALDI